MIEVLVFLGAGLYIIGVIAMVASAVFAWSISDGDAEERAEATRLLRMAPVWPLALLRLLLTIAHHKEDR